MTEEDRSVTKFREYLRIKSVHPNPDYGACIQWIKVQAMELNLKAQVVHFPAPGLFAVFVTWKGKNSCLKSIMLNSHIDVVPANEETWTHDPFAAEKDAAGNIYARGAQDTKCIGVQYLEAIRKLKEKGFVPLRDIHVVFVPDEEIGGLNGMAPFVKTEEFINLNVGFALDEGIASETEGFVLAYAERAICQVKYTARGTTGHSLIIHENTAAEKIQYIINRFLDFRTCEKNRLQADSALGLGHVTSVNMTMLEGGVQMNIVPAEMSTLTGLIYMRYVRKEKIPCLGFSPINNHPVLLHANDEFLNENTFLRGIDIYEALIWNLANLPYR